MSARRRKRYLVKGPNCPMAWAVLDNLIRVYMKGNGND